MGQSWLLNHNPHIDWRTGEIRGWGDSCTQSCLVPLSQDEFVTEDNLFSTNPTLEAEFPDLNTVPPCYHHLGQVFSKTKALSLPPHRPSDCAIDLIPGSTIPKGRLYSVSGPEKEAMRE